MLSLCERGLKAALNFALVPFTAFGLNSESTQLPAAHLALYKAGLITPTPPHHQKINKSAGFRI